MITLLLSMFAVIGKIKIGRAFIFNFFFLFLIITYFSISSFWSGSIIYANQKILFTLVMPMTFFVSGYALSKSKNVPTLLYWVYIYAIILAAIIFIRNGLTARSYQEFSSGDLVIGYQSVSRILGLGMLYCIISYKKTRASHRKWLYFAFILIFSYYLMQLGGRVGVLVVLSFVMIFYISRIKFSFPSIFFFVVLAISLIFLIQKINSLDYTYLVNLYDWPATIQRALFYYYASAEYSGVGMTRADLHILAIEVWKSNPVFGVGWGGFPLAAGLGDKTNMYPHNLILELLAETGLVGLGLFLAFYIRILAGGLKRLKHRADKSIFLGLLAVGSAISLVISDFSLQRELMLALGFMAGADTYLR